MTDKKQALVLTTHDLYTKMDELTAKLSEHNFPHDPEALLALLAVAMIAVFDMCGDRKAATTLIQELQHQFFDDIQQVKPTRKPSSLVH